MSKLKQKFEVKSHSYQIADTGDYDGYWEITNGTDRIITKEDGDEIEAYLQSIADRLNELQAGIGFGIETGAEVAIQEQCFKLEGQILDLKDALTKIANWELPETGKFWDKEETRPMSYEAAYGSNGVRDYIRSVARKVLHPDQYPSK